MDTTSLPTGTVTFLFTDIEGSTQLWEQKPEAMREALAHHDAVFRAAIEGNNGRVFKTMGDAFCSAFSHVKDVVRAAVEAQCVLHKQLPQVRVRMALHSGAPARRRHHPPRMDCWASDVGAFGRSGLKADDVRSPAGEKR